LKMIIQVLKIYYSQHKQDYLWIENLYSWNKNCKVNNFIFFFLEANIKPSTSYTSCEIIILLCQFLQTIRQDSHSMPIVIKFLIGIGSCYLNVHTVKYPPSGIPVSPILETSCLNV
jgi:hypothetical protein